MCKVYSECCKNCLLSKDRIVSGKRAKEIIDGCIRNQTYFICHKSDEIVCKTFYDKFGFYSQLIRIAERLGVLKFVPQTNNEKLISHRELNQKN